MVFQQVIGLAAGHVDGVGYITSVSNIQAQLIILLTFPFNNKKYLEKGDYRLEHTGV